MKKLLALSVAALTLLALMCSCTPEEKTKFDNNAAAKAYREFATAQMSIQTSTCFNIIDLDGDGANELVMPSEGEITAYTYKANEEEEVVEIGRVKHAYYNNAFHSENKKYPGLFVFDYTYTSTTSINNFYYITVKDGKLVKQLIYEQRSCTYNGEKQSLVKHFADKKLVEVAKQALEANKKAHWFNPIIFSPERCYLQTDYSKDSEYNYNVMTYNNLLFGEGFAGKYALYDVNGDGTMDLLTLSDGTFSIYTIKGTSTKRVYSCSCNDDIGSVAVLKNGDILSEYNYGTQEYVYDDLDEDFATVKTVSFGYGEFGGETEYTFAAETVTKEQWETQTKQYLNVEKVKINWMPEIYDEYKKYTAIDTKAGRDIGPFLVETDEILKLDGKYYQSSVDEENDVRYILVSQDEYEVMEGWQWVSIGTKDDYSLKNLGNIK